MLAESYSDLISRSFRSDLTTRCEIHEEGSGSLPTTPDTGETLDINLQSRDLIERQNQQRDYGRAVTHIAYAEIADDLKRGWRLVETFTKDSAGNWVAVTNGREWLIETFDRIHELAGVQTSQVVISLHLTTTSDVLGTRA